MPQQLDVIQKLSAHRGKVWSVNWHPSGKVFASCGEDKTIRIYNQEKDAWVMQAVLSDGHTRTIRDIAFSNCGMFLASASFDATVSIWDKKAGTYECNSTLEGHENEVKSVAWSVSGQFLATCSRDKSVWIWDITANCEEFDCAAVLNLHTQDVKKVVWHPLEDILASSSYDNTIKIYKEDPSDNDWTCTATLTSHSSTVWGITFDKTGKRIASCSDDCTVKIWQQYEVGNAEGISTPDNEPVWKCVCTLSGFHDRSIYDISWCKLTGLIATACGDDHIRIFKEADNSTKNEPIFDLETKILAHKQDVNAVKWNPVIPGLLLSTSDDGDIKIWKFNNL
ncbi:hypothetical protein ACKWTF_004370 [Chironomus riparius]